MIVDIERRKTNWLLMKILDFDNKINKSLSSDDLEYSRHLMRMIDSTLSKYSQWINSNEAKQYFYNSVKLTEEVFEVIDDELDEIILDTCLSANEIIERMYRVGESRGYRDIRQARVFNDATKLSLKFLQDYNFDLIKRLSDDLRGSVRHHIFRGVAEGQSVYEVAKAIGESGLKPLPGMTLSAVQRAKMIARTEVGRAMLTGTLQAYENYGVEQVEVLTAGDTNVCTICQQAEKNNPYDINDTDNLPLFHPNCRCSVLAIVEDYEELEENKNVKIFDLLPFHFYNKFESNQRNSLFKEISEDKLPNELPGIIKFSMFDFDKFIKDEQVEWGYIINLTDGNISDYVTSDNPYEVYIGQVNMVFQEDDEISISHFHIDDVPFNDEDFNEMLQTDFIFQKYLIVHAPRYIYIAEFKEKISEDIKNIIVEEVKDDYNNALWRAKGRYGIFGEILWANYENNSILEDYIKFTRVDKYG
ncbi:MAG: phage minor head protein [Methanobrevibacter sp.]|uniref:phage minor head protein n=1 Tax=Methanobrevibacter sp. TaxID=66852 RepID=UPI0026E05852|nr:phage minor head protein [Methanobrevibacter sp.]MDO5849291.1 phage minor head protein [Methanobrevibacter sp.]